MSENALRCSFGAEGDSVARPQVGCVEWRRESRPPVDPEVGRAWHAWLERLFRLDEEVWALARTGRLEGAPRTSWRRATSRAMGSVMPSVHDEAPLKVPPGDAQPAARAISA
jgi:hypothetical protein